MSPPDIEEMIGLHRGHIFQGTGRHYCDLFEKVSAYQSTCGRKDFLVKLQ